MATVFSTSKFESMSSRPPTPPKDVQDDDQDAAIALQFLDDPFGTKTLASKVAAKQSVLSTPVQSPSSEIGSVSSAGSSRKRVSFIQTCNAQHKGLSSPAQWTPRHSSPLRPLPQTRVLKPLKSILKACDPASTSPQLDEVAAAHKFTTFADMLESIVKLLAQSARASRLDAYISLTKTMQAYERVPDVQSLILKMGLLSQFIQRDMQAVSIAGTGPDSQLISQSLRLLMALVRVPELRPAMDDIFCSFVIDRIILVTTDPGMPKTIINTHLAVLMQQNFRPKTMTIARVEKILDGLESIQERVSGNSVHAYRLRVYRKLVQQRPDVMIKHTERWFKHTVTAMLSSQKDINQSALDMAISAAKTIGSDHHVIKSVLSVLNREKSDGNTVGKVVAQQLEKMLATDSASLVPQVWGAVTALLSDSMQGITFTAIIEWMKVFQKAFSSELEPVIVHANIAYGFLVCAMNISTSTSPNWSKMLLDIPRQQLLRRAHSKKAELDAATSGYFALLYYSLGPTASHEQLDRYWGEFVAGFWRPFLQTPKSKHAVAACRIVSALLRGSRRPWDGQRALEFKPQMMVQREDLPLLDPKWVRKAFATVITFVENLLDVTPWTLEAGEDEPVKTMWKAFLDSLVEASSKEVMASTETKDAVAHTVNLLRRMWDRHTGKLATSQQKEDNWANKFCFLVETVVQKLGAFQFADKCLTRNEDDDFEVASTPSHRSRQQGPRISPLLYFVELLVSHSEGKLSDPVRLRVVELVLEPCLMVQNTRLAKLELLKDCSKVVDPASRTVVAFKFWGRIAALTKSCMEEQYSKLSEHDSRQLGKEYEVVVDILALGSSYLLDTPCGLDALSTFVDTVRREAGDGAVVIAVVEQVSKCILQRVAVVDEDSRGCLPYASFLLKSLPSVLTRRTLDQGKHSLSPSSPTPARTAEFDPYKQFYPALVSIGLSTYRHLDISNVESTRDFLAALGISIQQCPISLLAVYLRKIQDFVAFWIEDPDNKLQRKDQQILDLHNEVVKLWKTINGAIDRLPRKDASMLLALETLLTAGFSSRRRGIVNISVKTWNTTFGKESIMCYPSRLENALQRVRSMVELSIPSLVATAERYDDPITFYESDTDIVDSVKKLQTPRVKQSPFRIVKATRKSRSPAVKPRSPAVSSTPTGGRRVSSRLTPKVRLRHDNSQIQFEPILSSPTDPFIQESQILTERQKEMIERQRVTANIFSDLGSTSGRKSSALIPPSRSHRDAGVDDLPTKDTRTPIKSRADLGAMDVYLGSSPTPQARNRSQQVVCNKSDIMTPNAVRSIRLADEAEELGSSPPHLERAQVTDTGLLTDNDTTVEFSGDSLEYRQHDKSHSVLCDDEINIDEDVLPEHELGEQQNHNEGSEDELLTEGGTIDLPSSTVELQFTAQLDTELNTRFKNTANNYRKETPQESNNIYIDAPSQQLIQDTIGALGGTDVEVENPQLDMSVVTRSGNTSFVEDSFSNRMSTGEPDSQMQNIRRSSRITSSSPISRHSTKKRKHNTMEAARKAKKSKKDLQNHAAPAEEHAFNKEIDEDNIIFTSPRVQGSSQNERDLRRKSAGSSQITAVSHFNVPETTHKPSMMRSTSLLSQVETHSEDVLVDDTPAPKRARRGASKDVSEGIAPTQGSHVKRVSHVQVTPKSSSSQSSLLSYAVGKNPAAKDDNVIIHIDQIPTQQDEVMHDETTLDEMILDAPINFIKTENADADAAQQLQLDTGTPGPSAMDESQSQEPVAAVTTPRRNVPERSILTPRSIMNRLKGVRDMLLGYKDMVLGKPEEREFDDVLFDIRTNIHAAGARGR